MTPIGVVVAGLLVELLDLRLGGFDVLPDPVGWVVAASGLCRLGAYGDWFGTAALAAVVTALFALPDMIHPTRVIESDVGGAVSTTTKAGPPVGLQGVLVAAYGVATVVAVVLIAVAVASAAGTLTRVPRRSASASSPSRSRPCPVWPLRQRSRWSTARRAAVSRRSC